MIVLFFISVLAGILGRMGGTDKYDTLYRDLGVPILFVGYQWFTKNSIINFPYLFTFVLFYGSLTTYWDDLFNKPGTPGNQQKHNFWFSGFMVGLSNLPLIWVGEYWYFILLKSIILAIIWGLNNKYMPALWFTDRGIPTEFIRYFFTLIILGK
jgi:hypothetical protein